MQLRDAAFIDQIERTRKHRLAFGGKAGDDIRAKHHIRAQPAQALAERNRIGAPVPALHPLQDQVIAGL